MKQAMTFILALLCFMSASAQKLSIEEYIKTYRDLAMQEMKRTGVPAAIKLAQGIHETEGGNSDLLKRSNNHFGIKCKTGWTGESVYHDDDALGECFRKYASAEDSYRDHSNFLKGSSRYAFLFNLKPTDYKGWAYGLKRAGYATNPRYPQIIIKYIEEYGLQEYTLMAMRTDQPLVDSLSASSMAAVTPVTGGSENDETVSGEDRMSETYAGKTLFNGLRAVWATAGTSLLAIATEYRIPLSRLLEFNDLEHDGLLMHDEWIYLVRKRKVGRQDTYVTESEETPRFIAQINGIQLSYLLQYNSFSQGNLVPKGTKVYLKPVSADGPVAAVSEKKQIIHEVQPKEGLYSISRKYQVPVQVIRDINKLESDRLTIGQKLIISTK